MHSQADAANSNGESQNGKHDSVTNCLTWRIPSIGLPKDEPSLEEEAGGHKCVSTRAAILDPALGQVKIIHDVEGTGRFLDYLQNSE